MNIEISINFLVAVLMSSKGSVIEFHLYTWKYGPTPDEEVWGKINSTICDYIYPEICERNFKILGYHVVSLVKVS